MPWFATQKESLSFKIRDKNISEVASLDIDELRDWLEEVEQHLPSMKAKVAHEIIKELRSRVTFLLDVGLNYLSLNRQSASLSGGESQRIRPLLRLVASWSTCSISSMSRASVCTSATTNVCSTV